MGDRPEQIGPYRVLGRLGEGGMGEVFRAQQLEPVRREVALKVIKLGMDTRRVVARFETEGQALALMDHPCIAKVFDAGATPSGSPYFAMELVRGRPITRYCDERKLSVRSRLDLFVEVCRGVAHAHQKGVIHRDLRPSNVLVEEHDGRPIPKIIDFGVAKAIGEEQAAEPGVTRTGQIVGTPAFMSPEQADPEGAGVDTRTDVYSLGVLLYELLAGAPPRDRAALRAAGADLRRVLRDTEAPRPSERLRQLGDGAAEVAALRSTEPGALRRRLRGDLDWITMKAIEPDPARRYQTVVGLGEDLLRHLRDEPVEAGSPALGYRLYKVIRRHRAAVAVAAAVFVSLVLGLALATAGFLRASRAEAVAERERAAAELEAARVRAVNDFLDEMLSSVDPGEARGEEVSMRSALDAAAGRLDEGGLADTPAVEAAVRSTLGQTYRALGEYETAAVQLGRAVDLFRETDGAESAPYAEALYQLSQVHWEWGKDLERTEALARQVVVLQERAHGPESIEAAQGLSHLGVVLADRKKSAEAERALRRALVLHRRRGSEPTIELVRTMNNLASVLSDEKRYDEAQALPRQTLPLRRELEGDPSPGLATALNNLAYNLFSSGKREEGIELYRQALAMRIEVFGELHPYVAGTRMNLGGSLRQVGQVAEAERELSQAIEDYQALGMGDAWYVAVAHSHRAAILEEQGRLEEALAGHLRAFEICETALGPDHERTRITGRRIAALYEKLGRTPEAAAWRERFGKDE